MAQNYASMFADEVSERFYRESFVKGFTNQDYEFNGVNSVTVYSVDVTTMNDYNRTGAVASGGSPLGAVYRYGTPANLGTTKQTFTIERDRSFTFVIDRGDQIQSKYVLEVGKALARQQREVCVPEYDKYVIGKLASNAGNGTTTAPTKANAYEELLKAGETLSNADVPDDSRVALCSYAFVNMLHLDPTLMLDSNDAYKDQQRGYMGEVDGVKLVRVPSSRLPAGTRFIMYAMPVVIAPTQLEDFKIHDNPPGISGWLVEGRTIYDAFVDANKKAAIYYNGSGYVAPSSGGGDGGSGGGGG